MILVSDRLISVISKRERERETNGKLSSSRHGVIDFAHRE